MGVTNVDVSFDQLLRATDIVRAMLARGVVSQSFAIRIMGHARSNRSICELLVLWDEADNQADRDAALADIQEILES